VRRVTGLHTFSVFSGFSEKFHRHEGAENRAFKLERSTETPAQFRPALEAPDVERDRLTGKKSLLQFQFPKGTRSNPSYGSYAGTTKGPHKTLLGGERKTAMWCSALVHTGAKLVRWR